MSEAVLSLWLVVDCCISLIKEYCELNAAEPIGFESKAYVPTIGWMNLLLIRMREILRKEETEAREENSGEEVSSNCPRSKMEFKSDAIDCSLSFAPKSRCLLSQWIEGRLSGLIKSIGGS